jgi:signal transduction histidine kinase
MVRLTRALETWGDLVLAVALTALVQSVVWGGDTMPGPRLANAALGLVMTGALVLRRSHPVQVLAVVVAVVAAQALAFGGAESAAVLVPFLVAVYSAAAYGGPAYLLVTMALLGIVVHDLRDPLVNTPSQRWFSPIVTAVVLAVGRVVHARRQQAAEAVARAERLEAEREHQVADAVAAEQRSLGREIHDIVAHSISVMSLQAGAAEQVLDRSPERAREAMHLIRETGHEAVREMGRLLSDDDGPASPAPLPSSRDVPALVERVRDAGLDVDLRVSGDSRALPPGTELTLFRVAQEGLTNALRHAPRARTCVALAFDRGEVRVEVLSTGELSPSATGTGRGLAGVAERVELAGGRFTAGPAGEGCWRVHAVLPVAP